MKSLVLEAPTTSFQAIPSSIISEFQIPLSHLHPKLRGSKVLKRSLRRSKAVPHMCFSEHSKAQVVHEPVYSQSDSNVESVLTGVQANDRTSKLDHAVTAQF